MTTTKKHGKLINQQTLQFERLLPGPIERVWDYITDAEKRKLWFCGGTSGLQEGEKFTFVFHNSRLGYPPESTPEKYKEFGDGFESEAIVVKYNKPTMFVMKWEGLVTFHLQEVGDQVLLTLTHENLQDTKESRVGTLAGWHTHLDILADQCNNRTPNSFWPKHMSLEKEYEKLVN